MPSWVAGLIIAALCAASTAVWGWLSARRSKGLSPWTPEGHLESSAVSGAECQQTGADGPLPIPAPPDVEIPSAAIILAVLWLVHHLLLNVAALLVDAESPPFDPDRMLRMLQQHCLVLGSGTVFGWLILLRGSIGRTAEPRALGLCGRRLAAQLRDGLITVTAAWLPVFAVLFVTLPLRTVERQHTVLQLLAVRPTFEVYLWAVLAAVVIAPLFEELVFRVVLQTWLMRRVGMWSIPAVALLFAAVHGFPDSLAIIPLALVLGTAYHVRRSYWTIVTAHALFNAVMLALDAALTDR